MSKETFKNLGYLTWHGFWCIYCLGYMFVSDLNWWWVLVLAVFIGASTCFAETWKKL